MRYVLIVLLSLCCAAVFGQSNIPAALPSAYPKLDTVSYYQVKNESMTIDKSHVVYSIDDKVVTQERWNKMTIGKEKIKTCKPCVVNAFNEQDVAVYTAVQYTTCKVGAYTSYYPDGKVKATGHYKENTTGKWDKPTLDKFCGIKDGSWTYYNEAGKTTATELYKDGKLIKRLH